MQVLVLASGSKYRAELLNRLNLNFEQYAPDVDESPAPGEFPNELAMRLAEAKLNAESIEQYIEGNSNAITIASDQVVTVAGKILGKPGNAAKARAQLQMMQSRQVTFYTSLCIKQTGSGDIFRHLDTTTAHLRTLKDEEIARYVAADQPLDSAGSFKVELLGISLFDRIESDDPTALIGLPLIAVCRGLRKFGFNIP